MAFNPPTSAEADRAASRERISRAQNPITVRQTASPRPVVPGGFSSTAWDFQMRHLTNASTQGKNRSDVLIDSEVPPEYRNFTRYSTLAGLSEIMK